MPQKTSPISASNERRFGEKRNNLFYNHTYSAVLQFLLYNSYYKYKIECEIQRLDTSYTYRDISGLIKKTTWECNLKPKMDKKGYIQKVQGKDGRVYTFKVNALKIIHDLHEEFFKFIASLIEERSLIGMVDKLKEYYSKKESAKREKKHEYIDKKNKDYLIVRRNLNKEIGQYSDFLFAVAANDDINNIPLKLGHKGDFTGVGEWFESLRAFIGDFEEKITTAGSLSSLETFNEFHFLLMLKIKPHKNWDEMDHGFYDTFKEIFDEWSINYTESEWRRNKAENVKMIGRFAMLYCFFAKFAFEKELEELMSYMKGDKKRLSKKTRTLLESKGILKKPSTQSPWRQYQYSYIQVQEVYKNLKKAYDKQGWWPIINNNTLMCEYGVEAPKSSAEALEISVGAILTQGTQWYPNVVRAIQQLKLGRQFTKKELEVIRKAEIIKGKISEKPKNITKHKILAQNTSWNNVGKALYQLNRAKVMSQSGFQKINVKKLAFLIKSSGYYNQKAKKIKTFMAAVMKQGFSSFMKDKELREKLLEVKGIGPETADSIVLYAANQPYFVIDAYTKRIMSRYLGKDYKTYDGWQKLFMDNLKKDTNLFKEYHALLVEHAKQHCRTKPVCKNCPLKKSCKSSRT